MVVVLAVTINREKSRVPSVTSGNRRCWISSHSTMLRYAAAAASLIPNLPTIRSFSSRSSTLRKCIVDSQHPSVRSTNRILSSPRKPSSTFELARVLGSLAKKKDKRPLHFHYFTAIYLYKRLVDRDRAIAPNIHVFNILLTCYSWFDHVDGVLVSFSVLGKILKMGYRPNTITFRKLLRDLCTTDMVDEALDLHDKAVAQGFKLDQVSYGILINGVCKNGLRDELIGGVLERMQAAGVALNAVMYNTLIHSLCHVGLVRKALALYSYMVANGISPDAVTYATLIYWLCLERELKIAIDMTNEMVLRGIKPDVFIFNSLIDAFCKQGEVKKALDMLDVMIRDGVKPDLVTFSSLIEGYCLLNDTSNATKVFSFVQSRTAPTARCYNILINGLCKTEETLGDAVTLFREMVGKNLTPNDVTLTTMIGALYKFDRADQAWTFYRETCNRGQGQFAKSATINILLCALCKEGDFEKAFKFYYDIHYSGIQLDRHTYKTLIDGLNKGGRHEAAQVVINIFHKLYLVRPPLVTYQAM